MVVISVGVGIWLVVVVLLIVAFEGSWFLGVGTDPGGRFQKEGWV